MWVMGLDFEDCVRKGLLRRIAPSADKAKLSMKRAERWLEEAEKNLNNELYDSCLIPSYLAMFQSARAVLFRMGGERKIISVSPDISKRCILKRANLKGSGLTCLTG